MDKQPAARGARLEEIARGCGATPATVGIMRGEIVVGLME